MHKVSWIKRLCIPLASLIFPITILAFLIPGPRLLQNIAHAFFLGLTAPFSPHWLLAAFTGPVRHAVLVILFVVLPVLLFPAYIIRPQRSTAILTGIGIVLWVLSCALTQAAFYLDD
jgi:hypothetical protein